MALPANTPILIVGAGPVGLSLALDLGWRGVECVVVDEGDGTVDHSKIGHIAVRTMEFFRRWGIAQAVRDAGFPDDFRMSRVVCTDVRTPPLHIEAHPALRDMSIPAYSCEKKQRCPQHWLQPLLQRSVERYPSVTLCHGHRLDAFEKRTDHVLARVRNLKTQAVSRIRAEYLVACDGVGSTVRESLGIALQGRPKLSYSIGVTVRVPDFLQHCHYGPAERFIFLGPEGTWGNLTTVDGRDLWRLTVLGTDDKLDLAKFDPATWVRRALGRPDANFEIVAVLPWRRREQTAEHFAEGRVLLAGDAVHAMSPTGGMGMNTGIGDVVDLGWKLDATLNGWGGTHLLSTYEIERKPVALRNAASSTNNFKVLTSPRDCADILEASEAGEITRTRISAEFTAAMKASYWEPSGIQMGYSYANSPVCVSDGTPEPGDQQRYEQSSRPGARAPHAWLRDGRSTLDLFGRGFVLLRFQGSDSRDVEVLQSAARTRGVPFDTQVIDDAEIAALYELPLVLVRPDGHVAWRGQRVTDALRLIDTVRGVSMTPHMSPASLTPRTSPIPI